MISLLVALLTVGTLTITPTDGRAPFAPSIQAFFADGLRGSACLKLDGPGHANTGIGFCRPVAPQIVWQQVTVDLPPGAYALTLYLVLGEGEGGRPTRLNTVTFVVRR